MTRLEEMVTLIQQAQQGNIEAYAEIVHRFQDMAYGYTYAYLNDFHLAQDAAQEAFIEAYTCLPTLREARAFPAWLKRIVFKHCDRMTRRKSHASTPLESLGEVPSATPGPDEIIQMHETENQVRRLIRGLPVNERVVTTLFISTGTPNRRLPPFSISPPRRSRAACTTLASGSRKGC